MPLSFLIAVALLGTAEPDGLRQLSSSELRTIVRGSMITRVYRYEASPDPSSPPPVRPPLDRESFERGGHYAREADNYEGYGSYRIAHGQVCALELGQKEDCFSILVDRQGQYWMKRPTWRGYGRVSISKIVDRR